MSNTITYKGYASQVEYDDDGIFTRRIAGIRDGVGFHADSMDDLRQAFHEAVEDYLDTCNKIGKEFQPNGGGAALPAAYTSSSRI